MTTDRPELDYWCARRLSADAWLIFLDDVLGGAYRVESPSPADLRRGRELQDQYRDLSLGAVDASIIALTERLGEPKVATLDQATSGRLVPPMLLPSSCCPDDRAVPSGAPCWRR